MSLQRPPDKATLLVAPDGPTERLALRTLSPEEQEILRTQMLHSLQMIKSVVATLEGIVTRLWPPASADPVCIEPLSK